MVLEKITPKVTNYRNSLHGFYGWLLMIILKIFIFICFTFEIISTFAVGSIVKNSY